MSRDSQFVSHTAELELPPAAAAAEVTLSFGVTAAGTTTLAVQFGGVVQSIAGTLFRRMESTAVESSALLRYLDDELLYSILLFLAPYDVCRTGRVSVRYAYVLLRCGVRTTPH